MSVSFVVFHAITFLLGAGGTILFGTAYMFVDNYWSGFDAAFWYLLVTVAGSYTVLRKLTGFGLGVIFSGFLMMIDSGISPAAIPLVFLAIFSGLCCAWAMTRVSAWCRRTARLDIPSLLLAGVVLITLPIRWAIVAGW